MVLSLDKLSGQPAVGDMTTWSLGWHDHMIPGVSHLSRTEELDGTLNFCQYKLDSQIITSCLKKQNNLIEVVFLIGNMNLEFRLSKL